MHLGRNKIQFLKWHTDGHLTDLKNSLSGVEWSGVDLSLSGVHQEMRNCVSNPIMKTILDTSGQNLFLPPQGEFVI